MSGTTIDHSAPVIAAGSVEIAAGPETVWRVLAAIEGWPTWNPAVKSVRFAGALAEGAVFRWTAGRLPITSTIRQVEPPSLLAWTGRTFGIKAIHVWRLQATDRGTMVTTEESWGGLPTRLFRRSMRKMLKNSIDTGLLHLKAEAQRL